MGKIKLGVRARCSVTGFEGILTAKVEYLNGCIQYAIKPRWSKDGSYMNEGVYVDVQQLEYVDEGFNKKPQKKSIGGSNTQAPSPNYGGSNKEVSR